jgi:glutathione S-transferase
MDRALDVGTSFLATLLRVPSGLRVGALGRRPQQPLHLYDFEGCPFCRKVREALSQLDLEAMIYPCPKGGSRYREEVKSRGGKHQFPYLVDPNTGKEMYESDEIVGYLYETYGDGRVPLLLSLGTLTTLGAAVAGLPRGRRGVSCSASKPPEKPMELWSFESSPYCRIAREKLCELEIPYLLHNVAKGSPRRDALVTRAGKMQVPYLVDPNNGVEMFESGDIAAYLDETYGA